MSKQKPPENCRGFNFLTNFCLLVFQDLGILWVFQFIYPGSELVFFRLSTGFRILHSGFSKDLVGVAIVAF